MNRRRLVLTLAALVLAAGVAALLLLPRLLGSIVEDHYGAYARVLNEAGAVATLHGFERGYATSTAHYTLRFPQAAAWQEEAAGEARDLVLRGEDTIEHGPLLVLGWLRGDFNAARVASALYLEAGLPAAAVSHYFADRPVLTAAARVALDGAVRLRLTTAGFSGAAYGMEDLHLAWQPVTGRVEVTQSGNHVVLDLRFPEASLQTDEGTATFSALRMAGDQRREEDGLWLGEFQIALEAIDFNPLHSPESRFTLAGFRYEGAITADAQRMAVSTTVELGHMTFGSGEITRAIAESQLESIDRKSYLELERRLRALERLGISEADNGQVLQQVLLDAAPGFLGGSPELVLSRIEVQADEGAFSLKGRLAFDGAGLQVMEPVPALVGRVSAELTALMSESLAQHLGSQLVRGRMEAYAASRGKQLTSSELNTLAQEAARNQLQAFEGIGLLSKEGADLRLIVVFIDGQLLLNGLPGNELLPLLMQ